MGTGKAGQLMVLGTVGAAGGSGQTSGVNCGRSRKLWGHWQMLVLDLTWILHLGMGIVETSGNGTQCQILGFHIQSGQGSLPEEGDSWLSYGSAMGFSSAFPIVEL